ncbi:histidine kinase [Leptospira borgpetersenii serovar Tarassovi]|nr:histidine kinase [Leptospira borgpetersenii serovar Tarassovi]
MLFSNELNYWVIKKNAKKDLLLRMERHIRTRPKTGTELCNFDLSDKVEN